MTSKQKKFFSFILVVAVLCIVLLPFSPAKANEEPLISLHIAGGQTDFLAGEKVAFSILYNLAASPSKVKRTIELQLPEGLDYDNHIVPSEHLEKYEYDQEQRILTFTPRDGETTNPKGRLQVNAKFPNYKTPNGMEVNVQSFFKINEVILGISEEIKVKAITSSAWELSKQILGDAYFGEEEVTYEMAFSHNPIYGELGRVDLQEVTFTDYLSPGATFVRATFGGKYEPDTHTVTWVNPGGITEGHANFNADNPRSYCGCEVSSSK